MSVRHAILGVLKDESMHGYQIATELEHLVAGGRYNSAQIYQGLHWLEERGFVVAENAVQGPVRDRRPYRITAKGKQEFQTWLDEPLVPARPFRDDVVIKLVFLCRDNPGELARALERLRRQHLRCLTGTEFGASDETASSEKSLLAELSGAALRFREQAEIRWIDHCLRHLHQAGYAEHVASPPEESSVDERRGEQARGVVQVLRKSTER